MKLQLFFILFSFSVFSQSELKVVLKDSKTNLPIPEAIITVLRTNEAATSNNDGVFTLNLDRPSLIEIYHSSYKKVNIKSSVWKDSLNIVLMEFQEKKLKEIILTNEHPQSILNSLVKNSIKKLTVPANLKVYSREFFKRNDAYTYFNDGLLNFQIINEGKNIKNDILVEQNRSIGFFDKKDFELLGYNLNNLMENYYKFKYLDEILVSNAKKKYNFEIEKFSTTGDIYLMTVEPYITIEGSLSNFKILYDSKKKMILEVSSNLPSERVEAQKKILDFRNRSIYKSNFKTVYRMEGNDYYLANSMEEIGFTTKKNNEEIKIEVKNNFLVTEFRTKIFQYNEAETFKDKTLINAFNKVITEFWILDSGMTMTDEEKDILNKIPK